MFVAIDQDSSGFIDELELQQALKLYGIQFSVGSSRKLLQKIQPPTANPATVPAQHFGVAIVSNDDGDDGGDDDGGDDDDDDGDDDDDDERSSVVDD